MTERALVLGMGLDRRVWVEVGGTSWCGIPGVEVEGCASGVGMAGEVRDSSCIHAPCVMSRGM